VPALDFEDFTMTIEASPELGWLSLTAMMTGLLWVPYIINRLMEQGVPQALWDPAGATATRRAWAERMMKAHANAVENLVVFAPLAIAVHLSGSGTAATANAAMVYFFARLGHFLVFTFGVPVLRVVLFALGFVCQAVLALNLLGWM